MNQNFLFRKFELLTAGGTAQNLRNAEIKYANTLPLLKWSLELPAYGSNSTLKKDLKEVSADAPAFPASMYASGVRAMIHED